MSASLSRLQSFYSEFGAALLLHAMIRREFPGSVAVLTSFAPDAAVLLSMVAEINPATPVLFLNTGGHSPEMQGHIRDLSAHLGLTDIRQITLASEKLQWKARLSQELESMGLLALITGRADAALPKIELDENGVFRINPLAGIMQEALNEEMAKRMTLPHPLLHSAFFPAISDPCISALGREDGDVAGAFVSTDSANWSV